MYMKRVQNFIKSMTNTQLISIAVVVIALTCIGILQYQWFNRSAMVEIASTSRHITGIVFRTAGREFQRYILVTDAMVPELGYGEDISENALRESLKNVLDIYGPGGSFEGLVKAVGYSRAEDGAVFIRFPEEKQWLRKDKEAVNSIPQPIKKALYDGRETLYSPNEGIFKDDKMLIVPGFQFGSAKQKEEKTQNSFCFAVMDLKNFLEDYIKPAVREDLSSYNVEWLEPKQIKNERPEKLRFDMDTYHFNPIRGLLGISQQNKAIYIPVPGVSSPGPKPQSAEKDKERNLQAENAEIQESDIREGKDKKPFWFRLSFLHRDFFPNYKQAAVFVKVTSANGGSLVSSIERRLALNWFLAILLLIGVGTGYILAMLQQARLKQLREREREFVASVTHELRTPITVINSAADNIKSGVIPESKIKTYGSIIGEQTRRLGSMIEEVLLFSQMEAISKNDRQEESDVKLHTLFAEMQKNFPAYSGESAIVLKWEYAGLPIAAKTDAAGFRIIVENLVTNALSHAYTRKEPGEVRIVARISLPKHILVWVEDDGRGISPAEAKKIFEPFYRDKQSRDNQEKGSGLGLYLAKRKAETIGGSLQLESPYERANGEKRQGCRFLLKIPYKPADGKSVSDNKTENKIDNIQNSGDSDE